ncbi:C4-dicarboxylate TRAP transporter substrate-binding protein [Falsiroseomonas sp. HC035]|uniref:C4-dicarboxylate TRAP transporter substrate-binding protein n=1 Tax=Falsiroseomonas sp. HC035 TaxID=3390999 RepID=UPI003D32323C
MTNWTRRALLGTAAAAPLAAPNVLAAQTQINITIAASHPTTIAWIWAMQQALMPTVNKELENTRFRIRWREAFGGTLYRFTETRNAVKDGITDVGFVGTLWEGSAMPLQNVTYFTPFATDNLRLQVDVMEKMHAEMPEMQRAWTENTMVYLGSCGTETYDLWTTFPVRTLDDLRNRRISAPGVSASWLGGTGAVPVNGALTTYYTDIQTGVSEGALSFPSGIFPVRVHEVAKYITRVNVGCMYVGGIGMNRQTFNRLDPVVQAAFRAGGKAYTSALTNRVLETSEANLAEMAAKGAEISTFPAAERQRWVDGLPDIAGDWARANEGRSQPAKKVLAAYMDGLRAGGATPGRAWTA